jgi:cell division protein FtsB
MGFLLGIGGWILKNPIPVMVALAVALFAYTWNENKNLKDENKEMAAAVKTLEDEAIITQENLGRIDDLQNEIARVRNNQGRVRNTINEIPANEDDRPFVDNPGLLDRIDVMRDHQQSVPRQDSASDQ